MLLLMPRLDAGNGVWLSFLGLESCRDHCIKTLKAASGEAAIGKHGIMLCVNQFFQDGFLCPMVNAVHSANPCQGIAGFQKALLFTYLQTFLHRLC